MNLKLETEFSKAEIFQKVDALKRQIDDMRPLPEDVEGRVMQKLRLDWNYHSNAIEGNRLSYGETVAFLMEGITAKGKPLKDHLDIRGHNEAINFLLSIVKDSRPLSEADIRSLHEMILVEPYESKAQTQEGLDTTKRITLGEYKTSSNHVKTGTGEIHYYATPEETPAKMQELMEWYSGASSNNEIHPVVIAALFHHKFVAIHPFDDGNGRLSRILMNLVLMKSGYPPVVIKMDDRTNYYSLLSRADNGDNWPFIEYIIENLWHSLKLYLRAAVGEDIIEDEDVDKEIALFQVELENRVAVKTKRTPLQIKNIISKEIIPLIHKLNAKIREIAKYFTNWEIEIEINYLDDTVIEMSYISSFEDAVKNSTKEISYLILEFNFLNFKEEKNNFDLQYYFFIDFADTEYLVLNINQEQIISRSYTQTLTKVDLSNIIMIIIKEIKSLIEANFEQKSPES